MTSMPRAPLTEADARPPRPGWAKALGIAHIVIATLSSLGLLISLAYAVAIVWAKQSAEPSPTLMGMDSPRYLGFVVIDAVSGLVANGFTFASGVALLNLRAWGGRVWRWLAPAKIVRLVLVWGGFIALVAPAMAANAGSAVVKMMQATPGAARGKFPTAGEMTLIYAWMFLAMGIGMIVLGSIYPAVAWWVVRRPGLRKALVEVNPVASSSLVAEEA